MHHFRFLLVGGMILFLFVIAVVVLAQSEAGELFVDLPQSALPLVETHTVGPEVIRTRYTGVDLRLAERQRPGGRLVLRFFEDAEYTLSVAAVRREGGFITLSGSIESLEHSLVVITLGGGQLVVDLISAQAVYQVRHVGDGVYAIHQIDQAAFPAELPPVEVPPLEASSIQSEPASPSSQEALAQPAADDGSLIDVLVLYTALARTQAGGTTQIQNLVNQSIAVTNQSYQDSGVIQRLNLVGMSETSYAETGNMNQDLDRLRITNDGFIDNAHTLRDQYKADLVSLIVGNGQYCGIAYQMSTVSAGFEAWAFSVVYRTCAVSNLSFAHELGHNMGARHDWYVDTSTSPFRYSHGHINAPDRWRTIMSYNNYCSDQFPTFNCTRIQFWSNPDITYIGDPLGVPENTCTGSIGCDADNARTLDDTRLTVANFRVQTTPTPTPTRTATPTRTRTPTPTPTSSPTPPYKVLLVDDIGDPPEVLNYYATPLATLKATVSVWDTGALSNTEPNATQMAPHEVVIWFTGDNFSSGTGPSVASETQLAIWLQAGGCLFLSSQDYAFAVNPTPGPNPPNLFMADYLGVESFENDVVQSQVTGEFVPFAGFGPYALATPAGFAGNYTDIVTPAQGAGLAFDGNIGPAGVSYAGDGFKTTYWGFPLEMISSASERTAILKNFLHWCRYYVLYLPEMER